MILGIVFSVVCFGISGALYYTWKKKGKNIKK
jgi:hypothetical protein